MNRNKRANDQRTRGIHSTSRLTAGVLAFTITLSTSIPVLGNPTGGVVVGGQASIENVSSSRMNIVQGTDRVAIDWRSFSIDRGEHVDFQQPSRSAIALNRVTGAEASRIQGRLTANGHVFLTNGNGVIFTKEATVDVAGLVATTSSISTDDFMEGRYQFNGSDSGSVINEGRITAAEGGLVALVSPTVRNDGLIQARLGKVTLASGNIFTLDLVGDELVSLAVSDELAQGLIEHSGTISADGGIVVLSTGAAKGVVDNVINMDGIIQARSVSQQNGKIVLHGGNGAVNVAGTLDTSSEDTNGGQIDVLGEQVTLQSTASLNASGSTGGGTVLIGGDFQGKGDKQRAQNTTVEAGAQVSADATNDGDGGTVVVWSDNQTQVDGNLSARGGPNGGDGGLIETSSAGNLQFSQAADVSAPQGNGGEWLLDPEDITIGSGEAQAIEDTLNDGGNVSIQTADSGGGEGNINVNASITKTEGPDASLAMNAHNDINVNAPISSTENKLHVDLTAGHAVNVNASVDTNGGNFSTHVTGTASSQTDMKDESSDNDETDSEATDTEVSEASGEEALSDNDDSDADASSSDTDTTEEQQLAESEEQAIDSVGTVADSTPVPEPSSNSTQASQPTNAPSTVADVSTNTATADTPPATLEMESSATDAPTTESTDVALAEAKTPSADTPDVGDVTTESNASDVAGQDTSAVASTSGSDVTHESSADASNTTANTESGINVNADITTGGGDITINAGDSGTSTITAMVDASNADEGETGGAIQILGQHVQVEDDASIDASGDGGGGEILIGGDYQGQGVVLTADTTTVEQGAIIQSNAITNGDGGKVIVWADDGTVFKGHINAKGGARGGDGGFVEVSGKQNLTFNGTVDTSATNGSMGTLLLDPVTLTIVDSKDKIATPNLISWATIQDLGDTNVTVQTTDDLNIADFVPGGVSVVTDDGAGNTIREVILPQSSETLDKDGNKLKGIDAFDPAKVDKKTSRLIAFVSDQGKIYFENTDDLLTTSGGGMSFTADELDLGRLSTRMNRDIPVLDRFPLPEGELTDSSSGGDIVLDARKGGITLTSAETGGGSITINSPNGDFELREFMSLVAVENRSLDAGFVSDLFVIASGKTKIIANRVFLGTEVNGILINVPSADFGGNLDVETAFVELELTSNPTVLSDVFSGTFGAQMREFDGGVDLSGVEVPDLLADRPGFQITVSGGEYRRFVRTQEESNLIGDPHDLLPDSRQVDALTIQQTLNDVAGGLFIGLDNNGDDILFFVLNGTAGTFSTPVQVPLGNPSGPTIPCPPCIPIVLNDTNGSGSDVGQSPETRQQQVTVPMIDTDVDTDQGQALGLVDASSSSESDRLLSDEDDENSENKCIEDNQLVWLASGAADAFSSAQFGGASTSTSTSTDANCSRNVSL